MVVVGASDTTHRLQMESLIPTPPQVDSVGWVMELFLQEEYSKSLASVLVTVSHDQVGISQSRI